MEQENLIGVFGQEMVCEYKGRRYYVRDNGAIYRQCKEDGVKRKWDEEWTFGKFDPNTGYMLIGQERVHRIVCTAYHGEPVGEKIIVDHIDTNRCNNRPDNLRWVFAIPTAMIMWKKKKKVRNLGYIILVLLMLASSQITFALLLSIVCLA